MEFQIKKVLETVFNDIEAKAFYNDDGLVMYIALPIAEYSRIKRKWLR